MDMYGALSIDEMQKKAEKRIAGVNAEISGGD